MSKPRPAYRRYLYGFFMDGSGTMATMDDLYFVGLTIVLAALTWLGAVLFARLMRQS